MSHETRNGVALVTGASSGIGAIYADRLAKRGFDLILVARDEARLSTLAHRLAKETGRSATSLRADLTNRQDLAKVEQVLRENEKITMLVNNAGIGAVTPLLDTAVGQVDSLIDLNVAALTRLTYAVAPAFVARGTGTIVNVASIVGISPETLNGVYGATKAYVLALTHSLQHELAAKGLRIQAVLPGATATDFWDKTGLPYQNLPASIVMKAEDMVDAALVGLDQGESVTIPSLHNREAWDQLEAARIAISQQFGNTTPSARYRLASRRASVSNASWRFAGGRGCVWRTCEY
jgi:short-subunit dehydrogenase